MSPFSIFIVEDDEWYGELLSYQLSLNPDNVIEIYKSGKELLQNLYKQPQLITLDYSLPDTNGGELLRKIKQQTPDTHVIIISGQNDVTTAVELLKNGAHDYIVKDNDIKERIWNAVRHIHTNQSLKAKIVQLQQEVGKKYEFSEIIKGNSPPIKAIFELIEKASKTNINVSITGETGTGKELVAKAIHYNSIRAKKPFVAVNVASIPHELIESELFGHEKGAFTGAIARRVGKFEEANQGTLFLDEIGEMDLNMQSKLLRVLQEREIVKVGSNQVQKIDVRVITATHRDLSEEVRKKRFREDLYYRLLGMPIKVPPLRQRGSDIGLLAKFFADEFAKENNLGKMTISPEAQKKLLQYAFPGNVRELKAIMELATVMANAQVIEDEHIIFNAATNIADMILEELTLEQYNKQIVKHFLEKYNQDVLKVAEILDIGKSTIYRMLKKWE